MNYVKEVRLGKVKYFLHVVLTVCRYVSKCVCMYVAL